MCMPHRAMRIEITCDRFAHHFMGKD